MEWIGYDKKENLDISSIAAWTEFTRRICYFSNHGSQNLYRQIPPSDTALSLHKSRIDFVLNIASESIVPFSDFYTEIEKFGWKTNGGKVDIVWEENIESLKKELASKRKLPVNKCSCQSTKDKCAASSRGFKNCCKACKACNQACKCRGLCENPHNVGGTCEKCCPPGSTNSLQSRQQRQINEPPANTESRQQGQINKPPASTESRQQSQINEAYSGESDTEESVKSDDSDTEDSDTETTFEQQNFDDYFSDNDMYLKMPENYSFTEIDPEIDIYLTDFELMSDSDDE